MMRVLFIVALFCSKSVFAASVVWDIFAVYDTPSGLVVGHDGSLSYANTSIALKTTQTGDRLEIVESGKTYLAAFTIWAVACVGDLISPGLFDDKDRLFYRNDGMFARNSITTDYREDSFYLAFETQVWDEPDLSGPSRTDYGWVLIGVTDGRLRVIGSAVGMDGQSMHAGGGSAIPEPSCALLLLLGFGGFGLCRKRMGG